MKKIFILITTLFCVINLKAEDKKTSNIPAAVTAAFSKEYAAAPKVKWEKERGSYEASFTMDGKKMSAVYAAKGNKEETETSIAIIKLPEAARKYAEAKGKIKDAAEIVKADGIVIYEAQVNGKDLIFDRTGKFIKETKD